jgi:S-DNA-T family DNA segregation ATPase FtsK/SpoIIIE
MRLSVTAVGRGEQHLVVDASPDTSITELAARIAAGTGGHPVAELYLGERRLERTATLSASGIRDGAVLGLDAPCAGPPDPYAAALMELHAVSGSGAGLIVPLGLGSYVIGSGRTSAIRLPFGPESAATVHVRPDGTIGLALRDGAQLVRVTDPERKADAQDAHASKSAAVDVDGGPILPWPADTDLAIGDTLLRWALPGPPDGRTVRSEDGAVLLFDRPPRVVEPVPDYHFRMPTPPQRPPRRPFGPSVVDNRPGAREADRRSYRHALAEYRSRRDALSAEVTSIVRAERLLRLTACPDPAAVVLTATGPNRRLWERRRADADYLALRVGTVTQPSTAGVEVGETAERRTLNWPVPFAPIAVPLAAQGVLGIAAPAARINPLASWLIAQLAVQHSPHELSLVLLAGPEAAAAWEWTRWLPHLRPGPGAAPGSPPAMVGNDEQTVRDRLAELSALVTRRREEHQESGAVHPDEPDIVLVVDGIGRLLNVPGMEQILSDGPPVRVYAVCLDRDPAMMPRQAGAVLVDERGGMTLHRGGRPEVTGILADLVAPSWCEAVARGLAPLRDAADPQARTSAPAETVSLLALLNHQSKRGTEPAAEPTAESITDAWDAASPTTAVPIGIGREGALTVDLVRDGPHALIAGAPGSGTSELLRTLIASLAASNRPDELSFLLFDQAGGSAFRECADLPHTLGPVTAGIEERQVSRVLGALEAELRRRDRLIGRHEAKDYADYQARRGQNRALPALARLVLVVAEFAPLTRTAPQFVPGLVSIARRGRTLGMHLVLATQRPAGLISQEIRANTDLRIALRLPEASESAEVIDIEDAARIPAGRPGRALLVRLGQRTVTPFQAAYSGGNLGAHRAGRTSRPDSWAVPVPWSALGKPLAGPGESPTSLTLGTSRTELAALVEAVRKAATDLAIEPQPRPLTPSLPELITVAALPPAPAARRGGPPPVPYGIEYVPDAQARLPLSLDLATLAHLAIVGAPKSGRTEALRTIAGAIAMRLSSADVHLYGIDSGGALAVLADLPHTGGVAVGNDVRSVERLLTRLDQDLTRRQEILTAGMSSTLTELRAAKPKDERPAHLLVLIDDWDKLASMVDEYQGGRLADLVSRLLREGAAAGIHLVVTGNQALDAGWIGSLTEDRLILRTTETPASHPPGRGRRSHHADEPDHPGEIQLALLSGDPSAPAQTETLRRIARYTTQRDQALPRTARAFTVL